jgi:hypothetical protein
MGPYAELDLGLDEETEAKMKPVYDFKRGNAADK